MDPVTAYKHAAAHIDEAIRELERAKAALARMDSFHASARIGDARMSIAHARTLIIAPPDPLHLDRLTTRVRQLTRTPAPQTHVVAPVIAEVPPRCPNDTDGDGDCHVCARSGHCQSVTSAV